jgi:transcriptional regulator with XRE-family HTH domain
VGLISPSFGVHVRRLRRSVGLRQRDVTARGGPSFVYQSDIERGLRDPHLKKLCTLADALGIGLADLLDETPRPRLSADAIAFGRELNDQPQPVQAAILMTLRAFARRPPTR